MSIPVDLATLVAEVARFGPGAFVVTTSEARAPHVASVLVSFDGDHLSAQVGRTTRANATRQPAVALVWPATGGGDFCLIVDAVAQDAPDALLLRPTSAVLHRLATAPGD